MYRPGSSAPFRRCRTRCHDEFPCRSRHPREHATRTWPFKCIWNEWQSFEHPHGIIGHGSDESSHANIHENGVIVTYMRYSHRRTSVSDCMPHSTTPYEHVAKDTTRNKRELQEKLRRTANAVGCDGSSDAISLAHRGCFMSDLLQHVRMAGCCVGIFLDFDGVKR